MNEWADASQLSGCQIHMPRKGRERARAWVPRAHQRHHGSQAAKFPWPVKAERAAWVPRAHRAHRDQGRCVYCYGGECVPGVYVGKKA